MKSIVLRVVTEVKFTSEKDLILFADQDADKITGFKKEILDSWHGKKTVTATTPRPEYGAITQSYVVVFEEPVL